MSVIWANQITERHLWLMTCAYRPIKKLRYAHISSPPVTWASRIFQLAKKGGVTSPTIPDQFLPQCGKNCPIIAAAATCVMPLKLEFLFFPSVNCGAFPQTLHNKIWVLNSVELSRESILQTFLFVNIMDSLQ